MSETVNPTEPNQNAQLISPDSLTFQCNYRDWESYLRRNIPTATISMAGLAALQGYYIGDATALYFYTVGISTSVISVGFFSGTYLLRYFRQKDDVLGYALSGGLNGTIFTAGMYGLKNAPVGLGAGMLFGSGYYGCNYYIYKTFRTMWLHNRRQSLDPDRRNEFFYKEISQDKFPKNQPKYIFPWNADKEEIDAIKKVNNVKTKPSTPDLLENGQECQHSESSQAK